MAAILEREGIDVTGVVSSTLPTISKTRIIGRTQQLLRLDIESRDLPPVAESERLAERARALVSKVHAVVLSDYAKGALTAVALPLCNRGSAGSEDSCARRSKVIGLQQVCGCDDDLSESRRARRGDGCACAPHGRTARRRSETHRSEQSRVSDRDHEREGNQCPAACFGGWQRDLPFTGAGARGLRCLRCRGYGDCYAHCMSRGRIARSRMQLN